METRPKRVRLTLTMDASVIAMAKAYAKKQGRSLSSIVEDFFKKLVAQDAEKQNGSRSANG